MLKLRLNTLVHSCTSVFLVFGDSDQGEKYKVQLQSGGDALYIGFKSCSK